LVIGQVSRLDRIKIADYRRDGDFSVGETSNFGLPNGKTGKITGGNMNLSSFAPFDSSDRLTRADN
jgi:hypothetical protein